MRSLSKDSLWLKQLHQWHWISSALCLLAMLLFSVTGITLNHAAQIEAKPKVTRNKATLPPALLAPLRATAQAHLDDKAPVPADASAWFAEYMHADIANNLGEWTEEELYVGLPRPGGDAWLRVNLSNGDAEYELTERGWISWLNDLHKGRNTGPIWTWFIDLFAIACLVFCVTGFLILKYHATQRPSTWPVLGLGVLIPVLIAILFIH
ncbi:PepSY-associated TM helix domain-containing protein [Massilia sp. TS11]|uniref:PepSY-associated TM helix domain-containing protein n=1 Tax=Massilia sp. TS11 TaxID=2908003 RepID=UPI001EDB35BA|nr:PepSY-associated TM helix domain-containing protein [Massilia sp. TS11]MCG2584720.1 PepSY-associated TM helix domain-containing protein [Massilia sp. TS11]